MKLFWPIILCLSFLGCKTRSVSLSRFQHPVILSKVRFPGDSKQNSSKMKKPYKGMAWENSSSWGKMTLINAKRAVRGVSKPYIITDDIQFHTFNFFGLPVFEDYYRITLSGSTHTYKGEKK